MKPKKLKIMGLNSFIEEQEIDFSALTERGLFGIFGPTGSGKSTILDAITLALYGETSRETNEFINTSLNALTVSYEFEIGLGNSRKTYLAERCTKRDKKGGYKTSYARLIEKGEEDTVIAEGASQVKNTVEKIVGLNSVDFTRSVVLPQGRFSEFLKLTGSERRNMLERIFGLERYGKKLMEKVRRCKSGYNEELNILTGELKGFQNISEDALNNEKQELKKLKSEEKKLKEEKNKFDSEYETYKGIWELVQELESLIPVKQDLDKRLPEIEEKKIKLQKIKEAINVSPFIQSAEETEKKIDANNGGLSILGKKLEEAAKEFSKIDAEYKNAEQCKNNELPELIKQETNIAHAIDLSLKAEAVKKEREKLLSQYTNKDSEHDRLKKQLTLLIDQREQMTLKLQSNEKRLLEIKVSPEYRDKVLNALKLQEELAQYTKGKNELEIRIKQKEQFVVSEETRFNLTIKDKELKEKEIEAVSLEKKELDSLNLEDNQSLLAKQSLVSKIRERLNEVIQYEAKKEALDKKLKTLRKDKEQKEKSLSDVSSVLENYNTKLQDLVEKINQNEMASKAANLAKELKEGEPCPVCGAIHHLRLAEASSIEDMEELVFEKNKLEAEVENQKEILRKLQFELFGISKEEEHADIEFKEVLSTLKDDDSAALEKQRCILENEFNELKDKTERFFKQKNDVDSRFTKLKDEKADIEKGGARLEESILKEKQIISELKEEIKNLAVSCENTQNSIKELKKELEVSDIKVKVDEIRSFEKETEEINKNCIELRNKIETIDRSKDDIKNNINAIESAIAEIVTIGKEKRLVIDSYEEEIKKICNNKKPAEYMNNVKERITLITSEEERLRKQRDFIQNEQQSVLEKKLIAEQNGKNLELLLKEQTNKLDDCLKENNFKDKEEAQEWLPFKFEASVIEKQISDFDENYKNIVNEIKRLEAKLQGRTIDKAFFEDFQKRMEENELLLKVKNGEVAIKEESIKNIELQLESLKVLLNKKKELEHKLSILEDLDKLIQGNKFVEFAAMNHLKYISIEASQRLKSITSGRYALELDYSGNFTMRDDFNGGVIRAANTLSGGETFLTSLSLALALSSQIQLKGSAPLEFFFLDEGFGTLDSELLDTVMTSLEKLHSDKLCVGIISHVEELKNRVPVKLIVEPSVSGKGGSKVRIDYT